MIDNRGITSLYRTVLIFVITIMAVSCASSSRRTGPGPQSYFNPDMDFRAITTAAVMPFENLTRDQMAADRVRDVFSNSLLSTSEVYVMPPGEVSRGILLTGIANPVTPSPQEVVKLAAVIKVDVVITGVVREYGEVRSGTTAANIISVSVQMIEATSGKIIWTASTTKGGISAGDRLFGGGGRPMNDVTVAAVNDIIRRFMRLR